jgi:hypothetical protein
MAALENSDIRVTGKTNIVSPFGNRIIYINDAGTPPDKALQKTLVKRDLLTFALRPRR